MNNERNIFAGVKREVNFVFTFYLLPLSVQS